jgi:hypothetical protein
MMGFQGMSQEEIDNYHRVLLEHGNNMTVCSGLVIIGTTTAVLQTAPRPFE